MANLNNIPMLWIDPVDRLNDPQRQAFMDKGFDLIIGDSLDIDDEAFTSAEIVVVRLSKCATALKELQIKLVSLGSPARVITRVARDLFELGIEAVRQGALTAVPSEQLAPAEWRHIVDTNVSDPKTDTSAFVFADPVSRNLLALAERVARVDVTVLLTGPTGAGKEVLSRILHDASPRYDGPFVAFNCAAMPENLVEDMLFGHEKGSFTGASKIQQGLFEQAQGGTIFLDEIGEMSYSMQAKLLRILQERSVVRLGGQKSIALDIRVIAATNRNLKQAIAEHRFREDLYFRLSAFKLSLPPLSERPLDILPLAEQFVAQQNTTGHPTQISPAAQQRLISYPWPGNVRELQNVIVRAMVLSNQRSIELEHLLFDDLHINDQYVEQPPQYISQNDRSRNWTQGSPYHNPPRTPFASRDGRSESYGSARPSNPVAASVNARSVLDHAVQQSECQAIMEALDSSRSRDEAADKLGISPRTLRHKLQKLREQGINVTRAYAR
ncbi:MAG TPA: sigma-54-dependent Fis family transcriptional regulator [Porticoccaceae bacterium]|nr:sigma-54-dependent Fis family transcriptional regulator [Porticoccaceae bacterium]